MEVSTARRALSVVAAALVGVAWLLAGAGSARAASSTGDVYVIHGIVGSTADVVIDGHTVATGAKPKSVVGPLHLAAGNHVITFKTGTTNLVSARFTVHAGTSTDVVAHRMADATRGPVVTVFVNDLSPLAPGKTRLVVSHVAVAPPADIRIDGSPLFRNVANGESLSLVVPAKTYSADIVPTATSGPAILAPIPLMLKAGTLTRVFAIGDASASTTDAVVQVLDVPVVGSTVPRTVHTGDGGQAADSFVSTGPGAGVFVALAGGLALIAGLFLRRSSARRPYFVGHRHAR